MSKFERFAARKVKGGAPQLDLKGDDFLHMVPEDKKIEIIVHFKGKNTEPEVLNPVHAFAKVGDKFKVINRTYQEVAYTFLIKEVKRVFIIPLEV